MNNSLQKVDSKSPLSEFVSHPFVKALMQLDLSGMGSALDIILSSRVERIRKERFLALLDQLNKGAVNLTKEVVESDDFLHSFVRVTEASLNSRRLEKIRYLGNLLNSAVKYKELDSDSLDEQIDYLDSLSLRELHLLAIIDRFEEFAKSHKDLKDTDKVARYWDDLATHCEKELGIGREELSAMLGKFQGLGLYKVFGTLLGGNPENRGKTTFIFQR